MLELLSLSLLRFVLSAVCLLLLFREIDASADKVWKDTETREQARRDGSVLYIVSVDATDSHQAR